MRRYCINIGGKRQPPVLLGTMTEIAERVNNPDIARWARSAQPGDTFRSAIPDLSLMCIGEFEAQPGAVNPINVKALLGLDSMVL